MAKSLTEIRPLARSHTRTAVNVLVGVMRSKAATAAARVSSANAILDRGWGRATQPLERGEDGAIELFHRIERIIVYPAAAKVFEPLLQPARHKGAFGGRGSGRCVVWDTILGLGSPS